MRILVATMAFLMTLSAVAQQQDEIKVISYNIRDGEVNDGLL